MAEAIGEPSLPMALLSSIGDVDSADANYALWNLSRMVHNDADLSAAFDAGLNDGLFRIHSPFTGAWNEFIVEFGSRGPRLMGFTFANLGNPSTTSARCS